MSRRTDSVQVKYSSLEVAKLECLLWHKTPILFLCKTDHLQMAVEIVYSSLPASVPVNERE